ncbi:gliding motility-associated C-terminal domain-containing protein [Bacteroidota bacterium]
MKNIIKILFLFLVLLLYEKGFSQIGVYCPGQTNVGFGVNGTTPNSTFIWNIGGVSIISNLGDTVYVNIGDTSGIFNIQVTEISEAGCIGNPVFAQILIQDIAVSLGIDYEICSGDVFEIIPDDLAFASYTWQDGSTDSTYNTSSEGYYWVDVVDTLGCAASDTMYLTVHDLPAVNIGNDTTLCGADAVLVLDASFWGISFDWSTNENSPSITLYPETEDRIIWVEVTDENNCVGYDTIQVAFCGAFVVPNAFTPNGDGHNDEWVIEFLFSIQGATVDVFDRAGARVFHSDDYTSDNYWDGTDEKGRKLPMDNYYYVIDLHNGEIPKVGSITLIR